MHTAVKNLVLAACGASAITRATTIQSLWSGYGEIVRLDLKGGEHRSVVLKHIKLPEAGSHPRGWNTDLSHQRKIRSYQVEARWYQDYAGRCDLACAVPACLAVEVFENETVLVLTDLDALGFDLRKDQAEWADVCACLDWLANFHATYMSSSADGLWACGSYWHLDTRPDELAALKDTPLREAARAIDATLRNSRYQTLIHGDAKLANFCFSADLPTPRVSAVDFQYVGRGCGMKDLAYFIGSCLSEAACERHEKALLDHYFSTLGSALNTKKVKVDASALEAEWRELYAFAWADFHRFLKGWSPGHWKINSYSEMLTRRVIDTLGQ